MTIPAVNSSGTREPTDAGPEAGRRPFPVRFAAWLSTNLLEERERWFLWLPVFLAVGIGGYFYLPFEPARGPPVALFGALSACCWFWRRRPALLYPTFLVLVAVAGFAAAQWRTAGIEGPLVEDRTRPGTVHGIVEQVEPSGRRWRVVLGDLRVDALEADATPARARIVLRHGDGPPEPGAAVSLTAVLLPLPQPAMPGAFDFARHVFFQGLGGVGYALSELAIEDVAPVAPSLARTVSAARRIVGERVAAALDYGSEQGLIRRSLAEALLIGQRGAIPDEVLDAMRDSGLAHILAISGLHIGLVAGFVFFVVRAGLALVGPLALRRPIRKWAAGVALVVAFAYVLLAGATVPTQRAFLMLGIGLVAILTDRLQLNMRPVAWAALAVLMVMPESLVGASFQLSFAAVVALVAAYEAVRSRWRGIGIGAGLPRDPTRARASVLGLYFLAVVFTSFVATLATAPFAITNFNRVAVYGIAANLVAVPVTAFWIMPWGIVALAFIPLGMEELPLAAMGRGLDLLAWVAGEVAHWPGAVWLVPALPTWVAVLTAFGGLWLAIWRRPWRLLGLPMIGAALLLGFAVREPDILLSGDGRLVAVYRAGEGLSASSLTREKFTRNVWEQRLGLETARDWGAATDAQNRPLDCDVLGCVLRAGRNIIALPGDPRALHDDCAVADVVAATVPVQRFTCRRPRLVIDRFDLWREGAHAIWLGDGRISHRSVREEQGDRPWSTWPEDRAGAQ